jgi:hypothetical protein
MKNYTFLFITLFSLNALAQDIPDSMLVEGWNPGGIVGINLSQVAFTNWAQGGSNSLAFSAFTKLGATYYNLPYKWKNKLNLAYGRSKIEDSGFRTTDNDIYFESVLSRKFGWAVDPYFAVTFRSAITKGYNYTADPIEQITDFFDPGYLTEALGFTYDHNKIVTTRLGLAFQQTFANQFAALYSDDPDTPNEIEEFKFDTGIESITELKYEFLPNMTYNSFLRLFSRFTSLDVWDVRWENLITAKINDYFNVNFNMVLLHEISQTRKTQFKEALMLGFSYSLF